MEIQLIMSEKGKELVLLNNFKYCIVRKHVKMGILNGSVQTKIALQVF